MAYSRKHFDSFSKTFNFRLTENQFNHLIHKACSCDLSPAEYLRKLIDVDRIGGFDEYKKSNFND